MPPSHRQRKPSHSRATCLRKVVFVLCVIRIDSAHAVDMKFGGGDWDTEASDNNLPWLALEFILVVRFIVR
jgi:hypothetical protein